MLCCITMLHFLDSEITLIITCSNRLLAGFQRKRYNISNEHVLLRWDPTNFLKIKHLTKKPTLLDSSWTILTEKGWNTDSLAYPVYSFLLRLFGLQVTNSSIKEDFMIGIYSGVSFNPKARNKRQKLATGKLENLKKYFCCISCVHCFLHCFFIPVFL